MHWSLQYSSSVIILANDYPFKVLFLLQSTETEKDLTDESLHKDIADKSFDKD